MLKDFDITKTKLIIWDLDDTFWKGTLSEGSIEFLNENLTLIQELTTRGIINSICSKNNYFNVKNEFFTNGYEKYWQLFVNPSISWEPKGERVKNLIETLQLREENVIVIDDNKSNINEIKFYCPNIMSAQPEQIKKISDELYLVNSYDFEHTRLKSYKIIEQKVNDKIKINCSNEEFLRMSEIKICIKNDCLNNINRIEELIKRTNQLNFTKKRIDNDVLSKIFTQIDKYDSNYIIAGDKYGNYGICGFYVLDKQLNKLEHFLFSCRIMNMGIEQFTYSYLNYPKIDIVYPVSSTLNTPVSWINIVDNIDIEQKNQNNKLSDLNILFKGMCDLYSSINYINGECNIDTEFPYWNKELKYISSHVHPAFIEQTNRLTKEELITLTKSFPYPHPDEFKTKFFDPKYNYVILSMLQAAHTGIYINKNSGYYTEYGYANCDITDTDNWEKVISSAPDIFKANNLKILEQFKNEYIFAGNPPVNLILKNLTYIRQNLNPRTRLILILGSEINTDKVLKGYENTAERHATLNKEIRKLAVKLNNIDIIELTDLIMDDSDYIDCINHFSRRVYVNLAQSIIKTINSNSKITKLYLKTNE